MQDWWLALSAFEKVFWYIAVPFSVILIIQMILTFAGMGGDSGDVGSGAPADFDHDAAQSGVFSHDDSAVAGDAMPQFSIFTVRNFIAFFAVLGWTGIAAVRGGLSNLWVVLLSLLLGIAAMFLVSALFYFISKLADSGGALNIRNALNQTGTVYLPIKANGGNIGKIQITVQDSVREIQALTRQEIDLPTGTAVKVTGIEGENILVVEKI